MTPPPSAAGSGQGAGPRPPRRIGARAAVLVTSLWLGGCAGLPVDRDRWQGKDKLMHFLTAGAISAAYTHAANDDGLHRPRIRAEALALTLSLGAAKEAFDAGVRRTGWSWKDMAWNLAGALVGHQLAWAAED